MKKNGVLTLLPESADRDNYIISVVMTSNIATAAIRHSQHESLIASVN